MERIIAVKEILRDVSFTLDWIESVTQNEADIHTVRAPLGDEHTMAKARGTLLHGLIPKWLRNPIPEFLIKTSTKKLTNCCMTLIQAERKGAVMSMCLGTKYLSTEAASGASLLVYIEDL